MYENNLFLSRLFSVRFQLGVRQFTPICPFNEFIVEEELVRNRPIFGNTLYINSVLNHEMERKNKGGIVMSSLK